jgi:hypothetical protein
MANMQNFDIISQWLNANRIVPNSKLLTTVKQHNNNNDSTRSAGLENYATRKETF